METTPGLPTCGLGYSGVSVHFEFFRVLAQGGHGNVQCPRKNCVPHGWGRRLNPKGYSFQCPRTRLKRSTSWHARQFSLSFTYKFGRNKRDFGRGRQDFEVLRLNPGKRMTRSDRGPKHAEQRPGGQRPNHTIPLRSFAGTRLRGIPSSREFEPHPNPHTTLIR